MPEQRWPRVPIGSDAEQWATLNGRRTILAVVHNVTSMTRLLDVLAML
jgi:hypothetical protein